MGKTESSTDLQLAKGLQHWVDDYRKTRVYGNVKLAMQIKKNIDREIKKWGLDYHGVYGTKEYMRPRQWQRWWKIAPCSRPRSEARYDQIMQGGS